MKGAECARLRIVRHKRRKKKGGKDQARLRKTTYIRRVKKEQSLRRGRRCYGERVNE